jgi:hypothetical protein
MVNHVWLKLSELIVFGKREESLVRFLSLEIVGE